MDGNCKAGLNSSVNVNVVDRVVFRFHKVIVYHVVKLLSKDWAQLNSRQQCRACLLNFLSDPFLLHFAVRHVQQTPFSHNAQDMFFVTLWTPSSSWKMPSGTSLLFYTKPTYRTNGIPLMNFGWKWDKKVFHRRSPHSKNCIVLDALAWRRVLAKFFNLVKWLVFSTTLAGCESDHSCSSLWNALEKSAELGGALHFLLMMESHRLSSLYSFW